MPYPPVDELAAAAARRAADHAEETLVESMEPYTPEERSFLLSVARQAIDAALQGKDFYVEPLTPRLAEARGVFTTLHVAGQLRGCVGQVIAVEPLVRAVARTAVSAAFSDPRFSPLAASELPQVTLELSVLSPLQPIRPEEIEIGKHGLVICLGPYRGLLLPQVATEYGWTAEMFLAQTCRKAGLPPMAWQSRDAELFGFTAEVFGE